MSTTEGSTPAITPWQQLMDAAALLDESDAFRVLRRFVPRDSYTERPFEPGQIGGPPGTAPLKTALYVDVETTGLASEEDGIIELAIVPFEFDAAGNIYDVGEGHAWLNDPNRAIPPEITKLTGITDAQVAGQAIDCQAVEAAIATASLVVAHNADFDRRFLEREIPQFAGISWGCSYREVEWTRFGCTSAKLEHILGTTCREFYSAHRALDDCLVGIHVLASAQLDGRTAFAHLLESVRQPTVRVYAIGAPFNAKDELKTRKYRWSDGSAGRRKSWFIDLRPDAVDAEYQWLRTLGVYSPLSEKMTARDRFSIRSDR